jgi:hypothetical protein
MPVHLPTQPFFGRLIRLHAQGREEGIFSDHQELSLSPDSFYGITILALHSRQWFTAKTTTARRDRDLFATHRARFSRACAGFGLGWRWFRHWRDRFLGFWSVVLPDFFRIDNFEFGLYAKLFSAARALDAYARGHARGFD